MLNTNGIWHCEGGCKNLNDNDIKAIQTVQEFCTVIRFKCLRCGSIAIVDWNKNYDDLSIAINADNNVDINKEPCFVG
jgi:hypothetical protein